MNILGRKMTCISQKNRKKINKTACRTIKNFKQLADYCHLQALVLLSKATTFNRDNITMHSSPFVVQYLTQYSLGASLNNCLNWIQPAGHNLLFVNFQKSKYVFVDFNLFYDEIQSRNSCRVPQKRLHRNFLENFLVLETLFMVTTNASLLSFPPVIDSNVFVVHNLSGFKKNP